MKSIAFLMLIFVLIGGVSTHAQSRQAEYLAVLEDLDISDMRNSFYQAVDHGFNIKSFWNENMERLYQRDYYNRSLKDQAKLSYLRLLIQMNSGMVDPGLMGSDVKIGRKPFLSAKQLRVVMLAQGHSARRLVENFTPRTPPYMGLKEAYRRVKGFCETGEWIPLPRVTTSLRLGKRDRVIPYIKIRLRQLGYGLASIDDVYDSTTEAAVRDIQWNLRFTPDGVISPGARTFNYLNTSCNERMRQIRLDMDKMRWLPQYFEKRHIFVNLAMSYLNLSDPDRGVSLSMKTINGRPTRRSPTMVDRIVYVVVNPYWVVPPTIFREDKLEDIRNLKPWQINDYFESHNYEVWNKSFTRRIDPSSIDWWSLDPNQDNNIFIRQKPSLNNALGALKFMMTNDYAIYLHDTNQRELFREPLRLLSSGCVRVEMPVDLAETLLKDTAWDRVAIENTMAKPGQVMTRDTIVNLRTPIPVYMVFLTSQLSSDGVLRFAEDSYGQSGRMLQRGAW